MTSAVVIESDTSTASGAVTSSFGRQGPLPCGLPFRVRHPPGRRLFHDCVDAAAAAQSVIATALSFLPRPWLSRRRWRRARFTPSPSRSGPDKRTGADARLVGCRRGRRASGSAALSLAMFATTLAGRVDVRAATRCVEKHAHPPFSFSWWEKLRGISVRI